MKIQRFVVLAGLLTGSAFPQTSVSSPLTVHATGVVNPYILLKSDATGNPYGFLQYDQSEGNFMRLFDGSEFSMVWRAGNVGIGTNNPAARLHIAGNILLGNAYEGEKVISAISQDLRVVSGWDCKLILGHAEYSTWGGKVLIPGGNVGIGTNDPSHKLAVNGTIKAKEVIVETTGWSDYVFADDYKLAPLSEVEAHIKANKHLPGIPSAAQVAENGVNLGDVQAALLAKIEEITLHQIAQQKELASLKAENAALKSRVHQLEVR
jgi:hypothetical protein